VGRTSSKGKRLIVFHAVTRGDEAEVSTGPGLYFLFKINIYICKEGFLKHQNRVLNADWGDSEATRVSRASKLPV
jgi:hypothetical protein